MPSSRTIDKGQESLLLHLTTSPESSLPVFIAGNFNAWRTGEEAYRMKQSAPGEYWFEFQDLQFLPRQLEYKYNRGDWDSMELDVYGNIPPNHLADTVARSPLHDHVPRWMEKGMSYNPAFLPIPNVISEQFEIPQLIKTRRISALLPYNYYESKLHYPVLYLQDGQNLFDDHAPFGNWAVDKKLAVMAERGMGDIIIVAIDHAEAERIAEFTPSYRTKLGTGDGKKYARFLTDTLKPYIDKHFRTLPGREHTGIGGSSMGALISIYAGLIYPEAYSKLMIFSPSLWVAPHIHFHFFNFQEPQDMDIYLYGGGEESANMIPNIRHFKQSFEEQGKAQFHFNLSIDPYGKHNEARWGEEFPKAMEWLFFHKKEA
ncbi:MAG: alpha/beta hydrolase [Lewinellaceae bacterium]|nr:alpha/beta hydrolase [Lewinellaceae bacterium]